MRKILGKTMVFLALCGLAACQNPSESGSSDKPLAQVASVVFTPGASAVASGSTVTLTTATAGATIYYTTDGKAPTKASAFGTAAGSTATVTVSADLTIKAFAAKTGMTDSAVTSAAYTLDLTYAAAPTVYTDQALTSALGKTTLQVTGGTTLYLGGTTANATIYYTLDGNDPTSTSLAYDNAVGVVIPAPLATTVTTLKAKAIAKAGTGWHDSPVTTLAVTSLPVLAVITQICPDNGSLGAQQSKTWFDVKILNKAALGAGWKIMTSYSSGSTSTVLSDTSAAFTALSNFADGDTLRIHQAGYTPVDTTSPTSDIDGNTGVYDIAGSAYPYYMYGLIWIQQADGTIVDFVAYTGQKNTSSSYVSGDSLTALQNAVNAGQWGGTALADAFTFTDSTSSYAALTSAAGSLGGQKAADWTEVPVPFVKISGVTAAPSPITVSKTTPVTVSATVTTGNGVTAPDSVTADLSALGGSAAQVLTTTGTASPYTYSATVSLTPSATGPFSVALAATSSVSGVRIVTAETTVTVKPDAYVTVTGGSYTPTAIPASTATTVTGSVVVVGTNCAVTSVTADLSALGGGNAVALTDTGAGTYSASFNVNAPVGAYSIPITVKADQGAPDQVFSATIYVASAPAFDGSDMENGGPAGLPSNASISTDTAHGGAGSFHYKATLAANATLPLTTNKFLTNGSFTKLVFWFKGSVSGTAPGLRIQVASGGTVANYYDLNAIVSGTTLVPPLLSSGSYSTTAITVSEWTKVELDLTGVNWTSSGKTAITDYALTFRVRSPSTHDWYIDDVHFE